MQLKVGHGVWGFGGGWKPYLLKWVTGLKLMSVVKA